MVCSLVQGAGPALMCDVLVQAAGSPPDACHQLLPNPGPPLSLPNPDLPSFSNERIVTSGARIGQDDQGAVLRLADPSQIADSSQPLRAVWG